MRYCFLSNVFFGIFPVIPFAQNLSHFIKSTLCFSASSTKLIMSSGRNWLSPSIFTIYLQEVSRANDNPSSKLLPGPIFLLLDKI